MVLGVAAVLATAEVSLRVYKTYVSHVGSIMHQVFQGDPHTGFAPKRNLRLRVDYPTDGLVFTFDTNNRGLRGAAPVTPNVPGEYRILVLGDSFTFGIGVESNQTFSVFLQQLLAGPSSGKARVVNAGMPGFGTLQELRFLEAYGLDLKPDLVIVAYLRSDMTDNVAHFYYADGFVQTDPVLFFGHTIFLIEWVDKTLLRRFRDRSGVEPITHGLLDRIRELCAENGIRYLLFQIPAREATRFADPALGDRPGPYRPFVPHLQEKVEVFDLFQAQGETPYLPERHLNPFGHRLVAQALAREIVDRRFLERPEPTSPSSAARPPGGGDSSAGLRGASH